MIRRIREGKWKTNKLCYDTSKKVYLFYHKRQPENYDGNHGKYELLETFTASNEEEAIRHYSEAVDKVFKAESAADTNYNRRIKEVASNMVEVYPNGGIKNGNN